LKIIKNALPTTVQCGLWQNVARDAMFDPSSRI
jgi:hypothetical protein